MVQQEIKWKLKFIDYPQDGFTHMHIDIFKTQWLKHDHLYDPL